MAQPRTLLTRLKSWPFFFYDPFVLEVDIGIGEHHASDFGIASRWKVGQRIFRHLDECWKHQLKYFILDYVTDIIDCLIIYTMYHYSLCCFAPLPSHFSPTPFSSFHPLPLPRKSFATPFENLPIPIPLPIQIALPCPSTFSPFSPNHATTAICVEYGERQTTL